MIVFYPRCIGVWTGVFDFNPPITLTPREKDDHKVFRNRAELIEFLKEHGVRLDDPEFPLRFNASPPNSRFVKGNASQGEHFTVVQWSVLGWIRDDYK